MIIMMMMIDNDDNMMMMVVVVVKMFAIHGASKSRCEFKCVVLF